MALDYIQHKTDGSGKKQRFISLDDFFFETVSIKKNHTFSFCIDLPFVTNEFLYFCLVNKTTSYILKIISMNLTQSVNATNCPNIEMVANAIYKYSNIGSVSPGTSITAVAHDTSFSLPSNIYIYYKQDSPGFQHGGSADLGDPIILFNSIPAVSILDLASFSTQIMRRNLYCLRKNISLIKPITLNPSEGLAVSIADLNTTKSLRLFQECTFEVIEI